MDRRTVGRSGFWLFWGFRSFKRFVSYKKKEEEEEEEEEKGKYIKKMVIFRVLPTHVVPPHTERQEEAKKQSGEMVVGIYRSVGLFFMLKGKIVSVSGSKKGKKNGQKCVERATDHRTTISSRPFSKPPSLQL